MAQRLRSMEESAPTRAVRWTLSLLACGLTLLWLMHRQIGSGFAMLLGDAFDGYIQTSLMQHWFNVLRGLERWDTPGYFYPYRGTLGYNDGFLINGVLFALGRLVGLDPFLASEAASGVIRAIGFFAFEAFAAQALGFGFGWALLGAILFSVANGLFDQAGHAQLLSVSFAPLLGWCLWRGVRALRARDDGPAALWGSAAGLLYGAWLLTGFYMAWFTALFIILTMLAAALQHMTGRGAAWAAWRGMIARPLIPAGAVLAMALIPFALVYGPKLRETGAHHFIETTQFLPSPLALLHLGSQNLLFGRLDRWAVQALQPALPDYGELTIGTPPMLALLAIAGGVLAWRGRGGRPPYLRPLAGATAVAFLLMVQVGGVSLWHAVFTLVPGASAVRSVARFALFLEGPVILLALYALRSCTRHWPGWAVAGLAVLLVAEEINLFNPVVLDRASGLHMLNAIPPPPPACRSFFVQAGREGRGAGNARIDSLYPHNVDAMLVAEILALPTINGFSTFNPPDWNFDAIDRGDYGARVRNYADRHGLLQGLCGLDLVRNAWDVAPALKMANLDLDQPVRLGTAQGSAEQYLASGWDLFDPNGGWGEGRWINHRDADLSFAAVPPPGHALVLQFEAASFVRPGRAPTSVAVEVNGALIATWHPVAGEQVLRAVIPGGMGGERGEIHVHLHAVPGKSSFLSGPPKSTTRIGLFVRSFQVTLADHGPSPEDDRPR